jgi:hypothetical protein
MGIFKTILKLLSCRLTRDEMVQLGNKHFIAGLAGTWLVGIGRYWDDSKASMLQHTGMGSVIYIFVLSLFIWLIIKPFGIHRWKYSTVLTFISLTSFPAIFYAIPVERFFTIETANTFNVWFLAVVAAWRLALLFYFLRQFTQLPGWNILTVTLMPICLIITSLTVLNLHHVVFEIMGGLRDPSPHASSYLILQLLTGISALICIPLVVMYGVAFDSGFTWASALLRWKGRFHLLNRCSVL